MLNNIFHPTMKISGVFITCVFALVASHLVSADCECENSDNHLYFCPESLGYTGKRAIDSFKDDLVRELEQLKRSAIDHKSVDTQHVTYLYEALNKNSTNYSIEQNADFYQCMSRGMKEMRQEAQSSNFENLKNIPVITQIVDVFNLINLMIPNIPMTNQSYYRILASLWASYVFFSLRNNGRTPVSPEDYRDINAFWIIYCISSFDENYIENIIGKLLLKMLNFSSKIDNYFYGMFYSEFKDYKIDAGSAIDISTYVHGKLLVPEKCVITFANVGKSGVCAFIRKSDDRIKIITQDGMFELTCTRDTMTFNIELLINLGYTNPLVVIGIYIYNSLHLITSYLFNNNKPRLPQQPTLLEWI